MHPQITENGYLINILCECSEQHCPDSQLETKGPIKMNDEHTGIN